MVSLSPKKRKNAYIGSNKLKVAVMGRERFASALTKKIKTGQIAHTVRFFSVLLDSCRSSLAEHAATLTETRLI
jgi:hypothetical protein